MSDLLFFKDDELIYKAKVKPWKVPRLVYQDEFELKYSNVPTVELTDQELLALIGATFLFDVECYPNFFFVGFRHFESGKAIKFELSEWNDLHIAKLEWCLKNLCVVGYNSLEYDIPMLRLACTGASTKELYKASCAIIYDGMRPYNFEKHFDLPPMRINHVDLIEVAPLRGSLKLYAGRLHTKRMQDLPIDPTKELTREEAQHTIEYCFSDLGNTGLLAGELAEQLQLRVQMSNEYGVDLRSKSDAQIAEAVIVSELERISGRRPKRPEIGHESYAYRIPSYISYRTPVLRDMLEVVRRARFVVNENGKVEMPPEIADLKLHVGNCTYKMGIGGLHSTESCVAHSADENTLLLDRDVVSYYPAIILNQGLYPTHLGRDFLKVYRNIVERRIAAKKAGNKLVAASLKITINGSFGKLGSKWSVLYAPDLMIQVTITGQLSLLLLIEMIEDLGIPVISANTDGVLIKCPKERYSELQERVQWWERLTGFETEEARYKAVYSRDVNNYIAVKDEGGKASAKYLDEQLGCKVKGTFCERGSAGDSVLSKNAENLICKDAVMNLLVEGIPIEETIYGCKDIRRFVTIRNVTGGARKSDTYLAKVIRWYYSTEMRGEINRATKGDKVPNSDGARPLMELPDTLPPDVDYARYIAEAREILFDIGYTVRPLKPGTAGHIGLLFD